MSREILVRQEKMGAQIYPEYGWFSPPPVDDHLHEAMRRLLLEQILKMQEDPIHLQDEETRPLEPDTEEESIEVPEGMALGSKRKQGAQGGAGKSKRSKPSTAMSRDDRPQYQR